MATGEHRLTPFEEYLVAEDRPDFPCWIVVNFVFEGKFERPVLQSALEKTLERHPLLRSVIKKNWLGRLCWSAVENWQPQIEWVNDLPEGAWPKWRPLNIFQEPGFRLTVAGNGPKTGLIFHFHHAICDGKAMCDTLFDILSFYSIALGKPVQLTQIRPEIFGERNRLGATWMQRLKLLPSQAIGLWVSMRFRKKTIAALSGDPKSADPSTLPAGYPALISKRLSEAEYRKVRDAALKLKVNVNDLFVRDLFYAIGVWKKWKKEGAPEDWIRIVLPVDMRKPVDRFLSAANVTSIVTLDRRMKSVANRERQLVRAHEDMNWVKNRGMRFAFWTVLRLCRFSPKGISGYSQREGCQGSLIFANHCQIIGRTPVRNKERRLEVPGAVMRDILMVSPIRPGTTAALVVGTYGRDFLADLHYDPRYHSKEQAEKLLEIFLEQLRGY